MSTFLGLTGPGWAVMTVLALVVGLTAGFVLGRLVEREQRRNRLAPTTTSVRGLRLVHHPSSAPRRAHTPQDAA